MVRVLAHPREWTKKGTKASRHASARRMVLVLGLQRRRRGWSRGFLTVDAKWPAGARAYNQVDIESVNFPRPWSHAKAHEITTQALLMMMGSCLLSVGQFGETR